MYGITSTFYVVALIPFVTQTGLEAEFSSLFPRVHTTFPKIVFLLFHLFIQSNLNLTFSKIKHDTELQEGKCQIILKFLEASAALEGTSGLHSRNVKHVAFQVQSFFLFT